MRPIIGAVLRKRHDERRDERERQPAEDDPFGRGELDEVGSDDRDHDGTNTGGGGSGPSS